MRYFYITYRVLGEASGGCLAMRVRGHDAFSVKYAQQVATDLLNKDRHETEHLSTCEVLISYAPMDAIDYNLFIKEFGGGTEVDMVSRA